MAVQNSGAKGVSSLKWQLRRGELLTFQLLLPKVLAAANYQVHEK
jgi:hypothetical protein